MSALYDGLTGPEEDKSGSEQVRSALLTGDTRARGSGMWLAGIASAFTGKIGIKGIRLNTSRR
jgi:hypothetical protein